MTYVPTERFCNLHQHTLESHLDAICDIDKLFDRAKELGQKAIAITDHGTMGGIYKAWKASKRTGVKLIPGNEIYFVTNLNAKSKKDEGWKRYHLVLLATNETGYKNLLRITYEGFKNSIYIPVMNKTFPRVDEEILRKYSEGLFALSACGGNIIAQSLLKDDEEQAICYAKMLQGVFGERFYMELQPHEMQRNGFNQVMLNNKMKEIAEKAGIPLVATCDAHYITPEDEEIHDMLLAISDKKPLHDMSRHTYTTDILCDRCNGKMFLDEDCKTKCDNQQCVKGIVEKLPCVEFYVKREQEILDFFTTRYDAEFADSLVENSSKIADACIWPDYIEPSGEEHIPKFDLKHIRDCPDYEEFLAWRTKSKLESAPDDAAYMKFWCWKGFHAYCKDMSKEDKAKYWQRMCFEIDVYLQKGFASYMLIVADYIRWAKNDGILIGCGRGSCGGSLAAFLMGIHQVDPIKYGLLFERFQNLQKKSLPDVDTDFAPSGRDRVFDYVQQKYGAEHTAYISNLSRFTPKVVITDVIRSLALGEDNSESYRMAKEATADIPTKAQLSDGRTIEVDTMERAVQHATGTKFKDLIRDNPKVLEFATAIVGLPRNYSTHAAGVVISNIPLPDFVPVRRDRHGSYAVQYEKKQVEEMGLVKMDFLGLTTLDIISETLEQSKNIGLTNLKTPDELVVHTEDPGAYKIINSGYTTGCFQIEGSTLQPLCKPMKAKSVEDIALINALGRPSCSDEERQDFLNRRHGKTKIVAPHPLLEDILSHTYGISIYEEDLLRLAQHLAGWDLSEADDLRKLTKLKEKGGGLAEQLEKKFIQGCKDTQNMPESEAQMIWEKVVLPYSKYGFCIDGDQFISSQNGDIKMSEIKPGDMLASLSDDGIGFSPCKDIWCSGWKEVFEARLEGGAKIRATLDHRFLFQDEWTRFGDLIEAGRIECHQPTKSYIQIESVKSLGKRKVYDLEMEGEPNFVLPGGVVAHNCKAHAIAYSLIGYMTAYYKYHARAPFFAAVLNSKFRGPKAQGHAEKISQIKQDVRRFSVKIDACDINRSKQYYVAATDSKIVTGLGAVKGLGDTALDLVIDRQPYSSFYGFVLKTIDKSRRPSIQALAKAGAFDDLGVSRKFAHDHFDTIKKEMKKLITKADDVLFEDLEKQIPRIEILEDFTYSQAEAEQEEWTLQDKLKYEKEVLGEFLSGSAKDLFPGFFKGGPYEHSLSDVENMPPDNSFKFEGVITSIKDVVVKKKSSKIFGKTMAVFTMENLDGDLFSGLMWPDMYAKCGHILHQGNTPVRGIFRVSKKDGEITLMMTDSISFFKR